MRLRSLFGADRVPLLGLAAGAAFLLGIGLSACSDDDCNEYPALCTPVITGATGSSSGAGGSMMDAGLDGAGGMN